MRYRTRLFPPLPRLTTDLKLPKFAATHGRMFAWPPERPCCCGIRGTRRRHGRSLSAPSRSARRRSAPSIPIRRRGEKMRPSRPFEGRSRSATRHSCAEHPHTRRCQSHYARLLLMTDRGGSLGARPGCSCHSRTHHGLAPGPKNGPRSELGPSPDRHRSSRRGRHGS
jgi:hypothetical protein